MSRKTKFGWITTSIVLAAILLLGAVLGQPDYEYCQYENTHDEYCTAHHVTPFLALEVGGFLDSHNGLVAALAGVAVAAFTLALKVSTDRLWKAGERALETTERAFVFLDGFNVELTTAADDDVVEIHKLDYWYWDCPELYIRRFAIQPQWKNSGSTPPKNLRIKTNWRGHEGSIPPEYIYRIDAVSFFIAPKAIATGEYVEVTGAMALIEWSFKPTGDEPLMFVWGRADYDDVFDKHHFVEWCYRVRFDRHDGKKLSRQLYSVGTRSH